MRKWSVRAGVAATLVLVAFSTGTHVRYTSQLPAQAQPAGLAALPMRATDSATLASVEAEGAALRRDSISAQFPPYPLDARITLVGSTARECVRVPAERGHIVRSGEFVVGGDLPALIHGRPVKMWWQPVHSAPPMQLLVRGRRLGGAPADTLRFTATQVIAPLDSDTHEAYEDEAAFPAPITFPLAGQWVVVATSRLNWGCFLFDIR